MTPQGPAGTLHPTDADADAERPVAERGRPPDSGREAPRRANGRPDPLAETVGEVEAALAGGVPSGVEEGLEVIELPSDRRPGPPAAPANGRPGRSGGPPPAPRDTVVHSRPLGPPPPSSPLGESRPPGPPPADSGGGAPALPIVSDRLPQRRAGQPTKRDKGERDLRSPFRLGEMLVHMGLLTKAQLDDALVKQRASGRRLGQVLVEERFLSEYDLSQAMAVSLGLEHVALVEVRVDPLACGLVKEKLQRRYLALPYAFADERTVIVAMADPTNVFAVDDLRVLTGYEIQVTVASAAEINQAIGRMNRPEAEVLLAGDEDDDGDHVTDIREQSDEAPIIKLVNAVISQAVDDGASDIHFEPGARECLVRFRIDGVLHEISTIPLRLQAGVISRLKIMADLDIAERRVPQDGRMGLNVGGRPIDLRVATLPTVYGEKVVMRILDRQNVLIEIPRLGFSESCYARFSSSFRKPYGAVLVTGPTGSGKSTTLYAALNAINTPEKNIITVEDPVEYRLPGINQVQINPKAGLTFSAGLRSILRCDPDIVMIGEIRDRETAQIAIESALTGHLVLSTLHTNSAPGALGRLNEMGVEPFLTGSAVDSVLAQRLARKLCTTCREEFLPDEPLLVAAGYGEDMVAKAGELTLWKAVGCSRCNHTGYKGRLGVYEIMLVSEEIERMTVARAATDDIMRQAREEGMLTLREDGLMKALDGLTTLEEIGRVVV